MAIIVMTCLRGMTDEAMAPRPIILGAKKESLTYIGPKHLLSLAADSLLVERTIIPRAKT